MIKKIRENTGNPVVTPGVEMKQKNFENLKKKEKKAVAPGRNFKFACEKLLRTFLGKKDKVMSRQQFVIFIKKMVKLCYSLASARISRRCQQMIKGVTKI